MIKDFVRSIWSYFEAIQLTFKYGWWRHLAIPGFIGLILAALIVSLGWIWGDNFGSWLVQLLPDWKLVDWVGVAGPWLGRLLVMAIGFVLFKHLLLVALSPFLSILSERVEKDAFGKHMDTSFSVAKAIGDFVRGTRIAIRSIIKEVTLVLLFSLLGLFGPMALISGILIFLIQAYYAGFGNMDFTLERYFGVRDSIRFGRRHRGLAIGNGMVFLLLLATGLGVFFAPYLSTVASTLDINRTLENDANFGQGY